MSSHCVIVGAGHGAAQLCASLRRESWEGPITLIGDEPHLPYHRPPLSKTQLDPKGDGAVQFIRAADFYSSNNIDVLTGTRVDAIDPATRVVRAGAREIPYDKLVLSTGSVHRAPPISGIDHEGVFTLRTAQDAEAIREASRSATRVVIIGAGFIGLEVAASMQKLGIGVTVLESAPRVLSRVTSPDVSDFFAELHRGHGVDLHTEILVQDIAATSGDMEVRTADGQTFGGDFVVLGTGAAANSALAKSAGLSVDNGIRVNEFNQTSNPGIYAIGDCCNQHQPLYGQSLRLESVQNAVDQAKTAALALTGRPTPHEALPWFWSDQYDVKFQIAGFAPGYDEVILRGKAVPGESFSAWYFKGNSLLAVDAVNDSIAYAVGTKLLKTGKRPDPALIRDTSITPKLILTQAKEPEHA